MKTFFAGTKITTTFKFSLTIAVLFLIAGSFVIFKKSNSGDISEDKKALTPDRPDLALEQDIRKTKDPALGYVPTERLQSVRDYIRQQHASAKLGNPDHLSAANWTERGPKNVGGRTRALMFDPNDATNRKVWAGGVDGGLWYTNDITISSPIWVKVDDFWANIAVSCIAHVPATPSTFYVGTGEGWYNMDAVRGAGIWKTTDGGISWTQLSSTNNSNFRHIQKIIVASSGAVYASTYTNGVYRSTDGGTSWVKVLGSGVGASTNRAADLEIGPDGTLYATMGIFSTDGVYASATGNAGSWTKLNTGGNGFPTTGFHRIEIACAPSNSNTIYAMAQSSSTYGLLNIYKSTNKGSTWSVLAKPNDVDNGISASDFTRGQAWYDLVIAVDPFNSSKLVVGGVDLFYSTNAGTSWKQISKWSNNVSMNTLSCSTVHADQHAIVFKPGSSTVFICGNDGGVYYCANVATAGTSSQFTSKNTGYNVTQFYSCAIHPTSGQNYFLAGAQDNGTQKFTAAGINSTTRVTGGDGAFCFIDQTNGNYQVSSYVYNVYYRSTNGGSSFSKITNTQSAGDFINPADYDDRQNILYSSYANTTNINKIQRIKGMTNSSVGPIETFLVTGMTSAASHLRVSPYAPTGTTTLFIGTENGKVFKVTNAQATPAVTNITGASFPVGNISCIEIGATEQDLLVTFSNYGVVSVWRTTDGGTTWSNKEGNLPDMPVRWAIYNPNNLSEAFLATEVGVWSTTDVTVAVPNWIVNNSGLANVRVDMFQLRNSDKELIAATHGRGLFSTNIFAAGSPSAPVNLPASVAQSRAVTDIPVSDFSLNLFPNPVPEEVLNITLSGLEASGDVEIEIYNAMGMKVYSAQTYYSPGDIFPISMDDKFSKGVYFLNAIIAGKKLCQKFVVAR